MPEQLHEYCSSRGAALRIDRDGGLIRGVKILGLASRNGRRYQPAALARAVPLYEGSKVHVNHPKGASAAPRDYQDRIGVIRNVTARADEGLYADFHFNPKHALAEQLLWDAQHAPENVGFSHNVDARVARQGDEWLVQEILRVDSVDLVSDPATTRGLFEAATATTNDCESASRVAPTALAETTLEQLAAARPDLVSSVIDTLSVDDLREHPSLVEQIGSELAVENKRLREQLDSLEAQRRQDARRARVEIVLARHGLPPLEGDGETAVSLLGEELIETLLATDDEQTHTRLVAQHAPHLISPRDCEAARGRAAYLPQSRAQHVAEDTRTGGLHDFVRAISHRRRRSFVQPTNRRSTTP